MELENFTDDVYPLTEIDVGAEIMKFRNVEKRIEKLSEGVLSLRDEIAYFRSMIDRDLRNDCKNEDIEITELTIEPTRDETEEHLFISSDQDSTNSF